MTMQNPLDLTQTDLRGLMEGVQTVANIPGVGGLRIYPPAMGHLFRAARYCH